MKETIDALQEQIPALPGLLSEAFQPAEQVETDAQAFSTTLEQLQQQCTHGLASLVSDLDVLQTAVTSTIPTQIAERVASLGQRLTDLQTAITTQQTELAADRQRVQEKVATLRTQLQQGRERVMNAAGQARQAVSTTMDKVRTAEQRLVTAFGVTQESLGAWQTQVEQANADTEAQVTALGQGIEQAQAATAHKVHATLESGLTPLQEALRGQLERLSREYVTAPVNRMLDETQQTVEQQLRQGVDALLAQLTEALRHISSQLNQSQSSSTFERQLLEPVFEQLQRALEPVFDALANVRSAAASVGIFI